MNIEIGDKIRFSTELLQQIHELPNHRSWIVRVVDIKADEIETNCKIIRVAEQ